MRAIRAKHAYDGERFLAGGATVLVEENAIAAVESGAYEVPADVPLDDFADATVLPGLIDTHVHLVADGSVGSLERAGTLDDAALDAMIRESLRRQAAAGVTTVRDLGDTRFRTLTFRDHPDKGQPRIVAAGPPLTTPDGHCHFLGGVVDGDPADAVRRHVDHGVDVIKVMASGGMLTLGSDVLGVQFSPEALRAIVDAGHDAGLPVVAHAHSLRGIEHAIAAGVDGIEHFSGLSEDGPRLPLDLLDRTAAAGIIVGPTTGNDLAVLAQMPEPPPAIRAVIDRLGLDLETVLAQRIRELVLFAEHGVRLIAGVDCGAAPPKPHGNVWIAVNDLVRSGLPVADALTAATGFAAEACRIDAVTGRLRPGLAADVLVVAGDLEQHPETLQHPVALWVRGELLRP